MQKKIKLDGGPGSGGSAFGREDVPGFVFRLIHPNFWRLSRNGYNVQIIGCVFGFKGFVRRHFAAHVTSEAKSHVSQVDCRGVGTTPLEKRKEIQVEDDENIN